MPCDPPPAPFRQGDRYALSRRLHGETPASRRASAPLRRFRYAPPHKECRRNVGTSHYAAECRVRLTGNRCPAPVSPLLRSQRVATFHRASSCRPRRRKAARCRQAKALFHSAGTRCRPDTATPQPSVIACGLLRRPTRSARARGISSLREPLPRPPGLADTPRHVHQGRTPLRF